jgi:ABC-type transport system substrate-binding protein
MSDYYYSAYKFFLVTWFSAFLGVLVSCSSPDVENARHDDKKIYHFPITSIPDDLDPAHPSDIRKDSIINEIFDGLVYLDESYEVQPEIAESWEYDSKTATYTFNLKDDVKFHNGKSVTSEDVKFSFERLLKQRDLPEYCRGALYIKGASDFKK